jgi:hypothetical protein
MELRVDVLKQADQKKRGEMRVIFFWNSKLGVVILYHLFHNSGITCINLHREFRMTIKVDRWFDDLFRLIR